MGITTVVSGSYRKQLESLQADVAALEACGVAIMSPESFTFTSEVDGFVYSDGQEARTPKDIEQVHLDAIEQATFVWLHAPHGYLGASGAFEVGWALRAGTPIYCREELVDVAIAGYVSVVANVEAAVADVVRHPRYKNLIAAHEQVYDGLAVEYSQRISVLRDVTEHAIEAFSEYLPEHAKVLDVGCGAGGALKALVARGYDSWGIDISQAMAEVAAHNCEQATVVHGDIMDANIGDSFDGILAFAFIHLYPYEQAVELLGGMVDKLKVGGYMYIGTTRHETSSEGWLAKADYEGAPARWRRNWTEAEFAETLVASGLTICHREIIEDPYGKCWMDFIARKDRA